MRKSEEKCIPFVNICNKYIAEVLQKCKNMEYIQCIHYIQRIEYMFPFTKDRCRQSLRDNAMLCLLFPHKLEYSAAQFVIGGLYVND